MKKHVYEVFDEIEKEQDLDKKKALLKSYGTQPPFNLLLSLNFSDSVKLDLPPGLPPFKMDGDTHPDLFETSLAKESRKLFNCLPNNNIQKHKKEWIFIQVLECIPLKDAIILCHCKDKALQDEYPSITKELVKDLFPNYVT